MAKFETSTAMNTIQGEVAMGVQSQRSGKRRKMSMARGGDGIYHGLAGVWHAWRSVRSRI